MSRRLEIPDRVCEQCHETYPGRQPCGAPDYASRFCSNKCRANNPGVQMKALATRVRHAAGEVSWKKGTSSHPQYEAYHAMVLRCTEPSSPRYDRYGGRGITVCQRWLDDFWAYLDDLGPKPDDGQRWTVDRIDNDGNYEPGNVRWATYREQANNKGRRAAS